MSDNKKQLPTNKKPQSARPKALISEEEREGRESKRQRIRLVLAIGKKTAAV